MGVIVQGLSLVPLLNKVNLVPSRLLMEATASLCILMLPLPYKLNCEPQTRYQVVATIFMGDGDP